MVFGLSAEKVRKKIHRFDESLMDYYLPQDSQLKDEAFAYENDQTGHDFDDAKYSNENTSFNRRDSSSGKLFVGGLSWETSEESFLKYFEKYGEVIDSVIMMNKHSGRPRGFGFVTFADSAVTDEVLGQDHTIDGRVVEVKRTVPREDTEVTGLSTAKKIFIGGIPQFFTNDELKEYFSPYGDIVECHIMLDHNTGRSRGFGFVTFDSQDSVEKVFSVGNIHEIGGKQVEIKRAEPKRSGVDYVSTSQKAHGGFGNGMDGFGGHHSGMNGAYSYSGSSAIAYGGYGGYGYGFGYGGPMYCFGGYGVNSYGNPGGYGGFMTYGVGNAHVRAFGVNRPSGYDNSKVTQKDDCSITGRYHPYWR